MNPPRAWKIGLMRLFQANKMTMPMALNAGLTTFS